MYIRGKGQISTVQTGRDIRETFGVKIVYPILLVLGTDGVNYLDHPLGHSIVFPVPNSFIFHEIPTLFGTVGPFRPTVEGVLYEILTLHIL